MLFKHHRGLQLPKLYEVWQQNFPDEPMNTLFTYLQIGNYYSPWVALQYLITNLFEYQIH